MLWKNYSLSPVFSLMYYNVYQRNAFVYIPFTSNRLVSLRAGNVILFYFLSLEATPLLGAEGLKNVCMI